MRRRPNDFDGQFFGTSITKFARFGGGGYSGPSEDELRRQREEERKFQLEMMELQRQQAREDAEAAKLEAAEEAARLEEEEAERLANQETMAQNASDAAAAAGNNASGSLSSRDTSSLAFIRRGGPQIPRPE